MSACPTTTTSSKAMGCIGFRPMRKFMRRWKTTVYIVAVFLMLQVIAQAFGGCLRIHFKTIYFWVVECTWVVLWGGGVKIYFVDCLRIFAIGSQNFKVHFLLHFSFSCHWKDSGYVLIKVTHMFEAQIFDKITFFRFIKSINFKNLILSLLWVSHTFLCEM